MNNLQLLKEEEKYLGKKYCEWSCEDKINYLLKTNFKNLKKSLDDIIYEVDNEVGLLNNVKDYCYDNEYGFISFNKLVSLMKICIENNLSNSGIDKFVDKAYSFKEDIYIYIINSIRITKENNFLKLIFKYDEVDIDKQINLVLNLYRNEINGNYYIENDSFNIKRQRQFLSIVNCNKIYDYFFDNHMDYCIKGIYNKNGYSVEVPIYISNAMVIIGNADQLEYGFGYEYIIKNNKLKKHQPSKFLNNSSDNKYKVIKEIILNDDDYENNIFINMEDIPVEFLKYLNYKEGRTKRNVLSIFKRSKKR